METTISTFKTKFKKTFRKRWYLFVLTFVGIFSMGFMFLGQSSSGEQIQLNDPTLSIYHIKVKFAEAYLIKDKKLILIEAGFPGKHDLLVKEIQKLGFRPEDIALNILTHGHGDHAGSAAELRELYHIPLMGSVRDLDKFSRGKSDLSKSDRHGFLSSIIGKTSDLEYTPFKPDKIVSDSVVDLTPFGVSGKVIPVLGGHTPGSLAVVIHEKYLFCGDLVRADLRSKGIPTEHWFQENRAEAKVNLKKILDENTALQVVFPGHNGKILINDLQKYVSN